MATIQEQPINLCRVCKQQHPYGIYVSDVTGNLYQIARTYSWTLMAYLHLHNHCNNEFRSTRGQIIGITCPNEQWLLWHTTDIDLCNISRWKRTSLRQILTQSRYFVEFNAFGWKVRYKPQHLSEGNVYHYIV